MKTHLQVYRYCHEAREGLRDFLKNNADVAQEGWYAVCSDTAQVFFSYVQTLQDAHERFQGREFESVEYCGSGMPDCDAQDFITSRVRPGGIVTSPNSSHIMGDQTKPCIYQEAVREGIEAMNRTSDEIALGVLRDADAAEDEPSCAEQEALALYVNNPIGARGYSEESLLATLLERHDPAREIKLTPRCPTPYAPTAEDIAACKAKTEMSRPTLDPYKEPKFQWGMSGRVSSSGPRTWMDALRERCKPNMQNSGPSRWAEMSALERGTAIHKAVEAAADVAAGLIQGPPEVRSSNRADDIKSNTEILNNLAEQVLHAPDTGFCVPFITADEPNLRVIAEQVRSHVCHPLPGLKVERCVFHPRRVVATYTPST